MAELIPPGGAGGDADHAADEFDWDLLLIAGGPKKEGSGAKYHPDTGAWISSPDNVAFDGQGRIWISTDQGGTQAKNNIPDGMYAGDYEGDGRTYLKFAVQHQAETDGFVSTYESLR